MQKNGIEQEKVILGIDLGTMVMGYGVIHEPISKGKDVNYTKHAICG